jgi:hypothetical protein
VTYRVGLVVGLNEGSRVGVEERNRVGSSDMVDDGTSDGFRVGPEVGIVDGADDGIRVGLVEGSEVPVGDIEGFRVEGDRDGLEDGLDVSEGYELGLIFPPGAIVGAAA